MGGSASATEGHKLPDPFGVIDAVDLTEAMELCAWAGRSSWRSLEVAVYRDKVWTISAYCLDDLKWALAGCDMVTHLNSDLDPGPKEFGVIVDDGETGYMACDEVSDLLAKSPQPVPSTPTDIIVSPNVCYIDGKAYSEGQRHDGQVCKCYREGNVHCLWE